MEGKSWDGFLSPRPCERCGRELRGQDSGYPAELYAGTFTGLCYPCTEAAAYEENYSYVSGARVWSHAPSCPSHRRSRETYYGFDGCSKCQGRGRVWVSRPDPYGGGYGSQCKECSARHRVHPLVARAELAYNVSCAKQSLVFAVMNRIWRARLKKAGCAFNDASPRTDIGVLVWSDQQKAIADEIKGHFAFLLSGSLRDLRDLQPVPWERGYRPTAAEVRRTRKMYAHSIPEDVLVSVVA